MIMTQPGQLRIEELKTLSFATLSGCYNWPKRYVRPFEDWCFFLGTGSWNQVPDCFFEECWGVLVTNK